MTSGVKSGLKSWLTFGSSVAGSQGGMARSKSMAAASESEMEADPIHSGIYEVLFWIFLVFSLFFDTFCNCFATFCKVHHARNLTFLTKIQNRISEKTRKKIVLLSFKKIVKTQFLGVVEFPSIF